MNVIALMEEHNIAVEPKYGFPGEWVAIHGETVEAIIIQHGDSVTDVVSKIVQQIINRG